MFIKKHILLSIIQHIRILGNPGKKGVLGGVTYDTFTFFFRGKGTDI
jgi:hypothetical protein